MKQITTKHYTLKDHIVLLDKFDIELTASKEQQTYKEVFNYINESPKANQHFWNFKNGKKKDFNQLVYNMSI